MTLDRFFRLTIFTITTINHSPHVTTVRTKFQKTPILLLRDNTAWPFATFCTIQPALAYFAISAFKIAVRASSEIVSISVMDTS